MNGRKITALAAAVMIIAAVTTATQAASAGWNYEQVDGGGGEYTSLLMVGDIPHISYATSTKLKYAWFDNTLGWQSEDVIASRRIFPSLAMDGGMPVISYYKPGDEDLCFGSRNYQGPMGHPWYTEVILAGGDVGKYNSLKVDGTGDYHLSFYNDTQGNLRYGKWNGTSWAWQTVDSAGDTGKHTSLALAGTTPHISYVDATNGTLRHAEYNGGGWDKETISGTSDVDGSTSIARDNDGDFHISFHHWGDDDDRWVRYATDTSGSFVAENVFWTRSYPSPFNSIAVDSQDRPIIAFYDSWYGELVVMWEDASGGWHYELVDDGIREVGGPHDVGQYCSIGLDTQERVHISYWDGSADVLMHA